MRFFLASLLLCGGRGCDSGLGKDCFPFTHDEGLKISVTGPTIRRASLWPSRERMQTKSHYHSSTQCFCKHLYQTVPSVCYCSIRHKTTIYVSCGISSLFASYFLVFGAWYRINIPGKLFGLGVHKAIALDFETDLNTSAIYTHERNCPAVEEVA